MADTTDIFYLEKMYPDASNLFSSNYKTVEEILPDALIILDTNILLGSFDASETTLEDIKSILLSVKNDNRLFIPARVAREFVNNRGKKIGELYQKMRQTKENLNKVTFKIDEYPLLSNNSNYADLKDKYAQIEKLVRESRKLFDALDSDIKQWNWNDNVSEVYREIFTDNTIIELKETEAIVKEDLRFRMLHKIAPGYNDSNKADDGVGDLIVWKTILELAKERTSNVIFVSNDQKNDWFYKQDKVSLYPKYELFDEFRRATSGKSITIIPFANFLKLMNAKEKTINEIGATTESTGDNKNVKEFRKGFDSSELSVGTIVEHRLFGFGEVVYIGQSGITTGITIVEIKFIHGDTKRFLLAYVPLRIADADDDIYELSAL